MHAAVTTPDHRIELITAATPTPGPGQLLLRIEASGICGSDLHALDVLGGGAVLGHEFVGRIEAVGSEVEGFERGQRVVALPVIACKHCAACLSGDPINCPSAAYLGSGETSGSFAEFVIVDAQAAIVVAESVPVDVAATIEPLAIALKIVERADPKPGERVLVIGGGPIGLAVTLWLRNHGVGTIVVSDPVASRRDLALRVGATHVVDPLAEELSSALVEGTGGLADVVIECAGRPGTFATATEVCVQEGRIVIAGIHMQPEQFSRLTPFMKNLTVTFCCWYTTRHYAHTVQMLTAGRIDPSPIISHRVPLAELDQIMQELKTPNDFGKVLIFPNA